MKPPFAPVLFKGGSIAGAKQPVALDDQERARGIDAMPHAPTRWRFEGWDLAPKDIDVSLGTELYRGASGEVLFRDYEAGLEVYRDLGDTKKVYRGKVTEPYYADYSTRNTPPRWIEMVSSVQVVNGSQAFELRGRSGKPSSLPK